jgi:hypothetical protein
LACAVRNPVTSKTFQKIVARLRGLQEVKPVRQRGLTADAFSC